MAQINDLDKELTQEYKQMIVIARELNDLAHSFKATGNIIIGEELELFSSKVIGSSDNIKRLIKNYVQDDYIKQRNQVGDMLNSLVNKSS